MTTALLLAQAPAAQTIAAWAIWGVVICGIIGLFLLFLSHSGVKEKIPPVFITAAWIVIGVLFFVFAIKLLMSVI